MNCAFYAGMPDLDGVKKLAEIWRGVRRQDVFPISIRMIAAFLWRRDFLISNAGVRKLIEDNLPYKNLEEAKIPVHIIATDIVTGETIIVSEGSAVEAILASTAIPGAFAPVRYMGRYLSDGAISNNTPIRVAINKGARRLIILPTGFACAGSAPPTGAVANALHALTLLIARQMTTELEHIEPDIECYVIPPLCPLVGSPYDFTQAANHIDRATANTESWIVDGGLSERRIPPELTPHSH
jgi:NTE family protein